MREEDEKTVQSNKRQKYPSSPSPNSVDPLIESWSLKKEEGRDFHWHKNISDCRNWDFNIAMMVTIVIIGSLTSFSRLGFFFRRIWVGVATFSAAIDIIEGAVLHSHRNIAGTIFVSTNEKVVLDRGKPWGWIWS
jgi:hypothetical protein